MHEPTVSRRGFLQFTSMAGIASVAGMRPGWADDPDRSKPAAVSLCFSLYGMRPLKLDKALKLCQQIGYDGVELECTAGRSGDPAKLSKAARRDVRRQLQELELRLPAVMENLSLVTGKAAHRRNLDRLKAVGELAHELSPEQPPVIETVLGGRPGQWESVKDEMAAALEDWARAAEKAKTVIAIKAHVGGALHTPHDARWLVDRVDSRWIGINYDYSHFQLRGFGLKQSLRLLLPHTVFIHVKDTRGKAGDFRFLLPGEGDTDYLSYFRTLNDAAYRGAVCVEVSGQIHGRPGYDPAKAARQSYAALAPAFQKAGLRRN